MYRRKEKNMYLDDVLQNVKGWAKEAGKIQMSYFRKASLQIESKSSQVDLVTEADKKSEAYILEAIKKTYPDHSILSEETGVTDKASKYEWVVDPLDGTTNFAQGIPVFAVSIALKEEGHSVLGVVYNPVLDELFYAIRGKGAYLNESKLSVSAKNELKHCVLASGFPYSRATNYDNNALHFGHMVPRVRGLRRLGAAAYDLANVAAGVMDGYWEMGLGEWDIAAGRLLVTEAGGEILEWEGKTPWAIIAGNKAIACKIKEELIHAEEKRDGFEKL
ncbi:inositol monophosphatase family protein [Fusibacter sp. JL216-2]|uniref:inositol monophosphatase family protein n=1 Tax=Fusibacter sp. JL216-2 TaxID=3071453 RepID=UPI003D33EB6B